MAKRKRTYAHILTSENNGSRDRYLEAAVDHRTKPQPESKRQTYAHILTNENRGDRPLEAVTNFKAKPRTTQSSTQSYRGGGHEPRDSKVPARYRNAGSGGHEPQGSGISRSGHRQAGRGGWEPQGSNVPRKSGGGAYDKPGPAKAYYDMRRQVMGSKTPNHRPDEQQYSPVTDGKERANHKYIEKVRTKNGKIRYIYDVEGGGQSHSNVYDTNKKNKKLKDRFDKAQKQHQKRTTDAMSKRYEAAVNNERAMRNPFNQASRAIRTAINSGRSWLKNTFGI